MASSTKTTTSTVEWELADTYEEAAAVIARVGILPLSSLFPEHPSLESITRREAWHTGLAADPWLWRDRFAGEGVAAYGRFMAKKPILADAALFPLLQAALQPAKGLRSRYADGLVSKDMLRIYDIVEGHEGVDVRELRRSSGLQDKESKKRFDAALIELQSTGDIVISGISDRLNDKGVKSGWNSTCYMLATQWMARHGLEPVQMDRTAARNELLARFGEVSREAAVQKLAKLMR